MKNQDVNFGNVSSVTLIEVGVQLVSRNHDVIDCGDGEYALVPTKDFLVFLKVERERYCDAEIKKQVRALGYGKAFVIKNYWKAVQPPHPF